MGVRTGQQYLREIGQRRRELWIGGKKISSGITEHPAFRQIARTMAALYDMQHEEGLVEKMTFISPQTGERTGMSFLTPRSADDIHRRAAMMRIWAEFSGGMLGRTPDYLNSDIMAMASAAEYFGAAGRQYGENIRHYYEYISERDLLLTHTLINPQVNRSAPPSQLQDPYIAARIVEKRQDGVVVRGARMLATFPLADEIIVFPSTVIRNAREDAPYAMAFALPVDTPGLKFICREPMCAESSADHPLSYRFDEQDAVVVFDDVLVPEDRIFLLEDVERANRLHEATDAVVHMSHQVVVRDVVKTEFMLGIMSLMADSIGIEQFQHVQEKIAKVIMILESMRALLIAAETGARLNRWGVMTPDFRFLNVARNIYPRVYPEIREMIQQLGASGLIALPTEADFSSSIGRDIEKYFQGRNATAREKVELFRLAWDVAGSSFGSRQELYERFFFGDPVRMASALFSSYDATPCRESVKRFLARAGKGV